MKQIALGAANYILSSVGCRKPKMVRVIPCQAIQSYISDREQNPWNFMSREISSFWFQNILNFFNRTNICKVIASWNLQCSHLIFAYIFVNLVLWHKNPCIFLSMTIFSWKFVRMCQKVCLLKINHWHLPYDLWTYVNQGQVRHSYCVHSCMTIFQLLITQKG